jgi:hypothetical protein
LRSPSKGEPYSVHISRADSVFENSSCGVARDQVTWDDYLETLLSLPDGVDSARASLDLDLPICLEDLEVRRSPR